MSRPGERKEKNCLNCNTEVQGRYCHNCGQENIEPRESVWQLITHFFQDITHFDGKFFSTVKYLALRPGFLSREYMVGRRAAYVNPIRMYIFTSAFFFLLLFTFFKSGRIDVKNDISVNKKTLTEIAAMDSTTFAEFTRAVNKENKNPDKPMTRAEFQQYLDSTLLSNDSQFINIKYKTREQYDSALEAGKKDNWFERKMIYQVISMNNRYRGRTLDAFNDFKDLMMHSLPQLLFLSLPLLALLLKLLYLRRKEYYYVNHGIFSLHLYIFMFLALLVIFSLSTLNSKLNWWGISWLNVILYIGLFYYEYKAMRNFYKQRRAKTIIKFILLNLMFFVVLTLLFTAFLFFSFFKL